MLGCSNEKYERRNTRGRLSGRWAVVLFFGSGDADRRDDLFDRLFRAGEQGFSGRDAGDDDRRGCAGRDAAEEHWRDLVAAVYKIPSLRRASLVDRAADRPNRLDRNETPRPLRLGHSGHACRDNCPDILPDQPKPGLDIDPGDTTVLRFLVFFGL